MSSNEKPRSAFYQPLEEHETLSIETLDSGELRIKFYSYKKTVNPVNFAAKLELIEKELNAKEYYIEGRPNKEVKKPIKVAGEVADKSTASRPSLTAKSDDIAAAVNYYISERLRLEQNADQKAGTT